MATTHPISGTYFSSNTRPGTQLPWGGTVLNAAELLSCWDGTGFTYRASENQYPNVHLRFVVGDISKATLAVTGYGIGETIPNEFYGYLWNYQTTAWDAFGNHTSNTYAEISKVITSGTKRKYASGGVVWAKLVGGIADVIGPPSIGDIWVKLASVDSSGGKPATPRPRKTSYNPVGKWVSEGWNIGWNE